jgi:glutamine synthetase
VAYNYIAGIMMHILSIAAVTNRLINSYMRMFQGYEAPC